MSVIKKIIKCMNLGEKPKTAQEIDIDVSSFLGKQPIKGDVLITEVVNFIYDKIYDIASPTEISYEIEDVLDAQKIGKRGRELIQMDASPLRSPALEAKTLLVDKNYLEELKKDKELQVAFVLYKMLKKYKGRIYDWEFRDRTGQLGWTATEHFKMSVFNQLKNLYE